MSATNQGSHNLEAATLLCTYAGELLDNAFYDHLMKADPEAGKWIIDFVREAWCNTKGKLHLKDCFELAKSYYESGAWRDYSPQEAFKEELHACAGEGY